MAAITLNSAVRSNLRALQASTSLLDSTERRISTGKKVNSALDNPSSFFTAQALGRRAGDLSNLLDSVSNSVQTLQAADNGISAITKVVESLKATARSALQSPSAVTTKASVESAAVSGLTENNLLGAGTTAAYGTITGSVAGLTSSTTLSSLGITSPDTLRYAIDNGSSTYNGTVFVTAFNVTVGGYLTEINNTEPNIHAALDSSGRVTFTNTNYTRSFEVLGTTDASILNGFGLTPSTATPTAGGGSLSGQTLSVQDRSGAAKTLTLSASAGADNVDTLDELNAWLESNDVALQASLSGSGGSRKLKLETANATPVDLAGTATDAGGVFASDKTFSAPVLDPAAVARRIAFVKDYNDALKQISSLAKDSSYNGVNLLQGDDLDVVFNEDGTSRLGVKGAAFDAASIGLGDLADADFLDSDAVGAVLDTIAGAFGTLEAQSSKLGSQLQIVQTRQSFTKDQIGTLQDGAAALTDADANEEAATLATLQTRQQLIVSALSISAQQDQNILQLLR